MEINSRTLPNLYPNINSIEGKVVQFITDYVNNGQSARGLSRALGIDRKTVAAILEELQDTELYKHTLDNIEAETSGFGDVSFGSTIFQRYETELNNIDKLIQTATDPKTKVSFMRVKHNLLRDQLKAMLILQRSNGLSADDKNAKLINKMFDDILEEAKGIESGKLH